MPAVVALALALAFLPEILTIRAGRTRIISMTGKYRHVDGPDVYATIPRGEDGMLQKAWLSVRAELLFNVHAALAVLMTAAASFGTFCHGATYGKASTSRQSREEAIQSLPLDELTPEVRQRVIAVVSDPSIYRRLPVEIIDCDPEMYLFLLRHPEVVVNVWDLMGVTKIQMGRTGPFSFTASDGMGTDSTVELVYGSNDTHVFLGQGVHHGRLFGKPLRGECVLLLKTGYVNTAEGHVHVTNRMDMFLRTDRAALDAIAKTIHPLFGRTIDTNFSQTVQFLERMSRTSAYNPQGMARLAGKLTKIDDETRRQFSLIAGGVRERSRQRLVMVGMPAR
jgi:hypothetical protein